MRVSSQYVVAHGVSGHHVVRVQAASRVGWPVSDLTGEPPLFRLGLGAVKVRVCNKPPAALSGLASMLEVKARVLAVACADLKQF
jgi:hypothetical protein